MTKNLTHDDSPAFVCKVLEEIRFPCIVRVDAHGFIGEKSDKIQGFQFASQSSSIKLHNEKYHALMDGPETVRPLLKYFEEMTGVEFLSKWFDAHDRICELAASGWKACNTKTLVLYLEPVHMAATEIFGALK